MTTEQTENEPTVEQWNKLLTRAQIAFNNRYVFSRMTIDAVDEMLRLMEHPSDDVRRRYSDEEWITLEFDLVNFRRRCESDENPHSLFFRLRSYLNSRPEEETS